MRLSCHRRRGPELSENPTSAYDRTAEGSSVTQSELDDPAEMDELGNPVGILATSWILGLKIA